MIKDNMGKEGKGFLAFILTLFLLVSIINLVGLIPYTFTPTAHIAVTFGLSLSIFISCVILGFRNHSINYLSMFMPNGAPIGMAPFLVVIELISHTAKALSLGLRLAANITAGHLLLGIFAGFT
jgi:ATP synthase subunit 6